MNNGTQDATDWENSPRYPMSRGHTRIKAIRDLADGTSLSDMAAKYDVTRETIVQFKKRHAADIQKLRESVAAEVNALWIADKTNRMFEYQQAAEDLDDAVLAVLRRGDKLSKDDIAYLTERRKIFRAVAEELGQLPGRNTVELIGATVNYSFEGVNPDDLH